MNALKVITLAAVAACGSTSLVGYNGLNLHGYSGLQGYNGLHGYTGLNAYNGLHGYTGLNGYTAAAPVAYSAAVAPAAVAPAAYAAAAVAPTAYAAAAVAPTAYAPAYNNYAVPHTPIQTQYHSQDELGQYSFGYSGGPSNRAETRDAYGNVRGSYNYIDSNGVTQTQHYVADALGFRVSGTNLPVAPSVPAAAALVAPVAPAVPAYAALVAPEPVQDTPEVFKAREEFLALYNEAAAAAAAAPDARKKRSVGSVAVHSAVSPLAYSGLHHGYSGLLGHHGVVGHSGLLAGHGLVGHGLAGHGLVGHRSVIAGHGLVGHGLAGHGVVGHHAVLAGHGLAGYAGLGYATAPAVVAKAVAPTVAYAAAPAIAHAAAPAAVHDAELLRVENNPGHAVSYRVY